jgi:hypothetical protein
MSAVQIYGISFCGSTMLDLMIGNDPRGKHLSCGEIYALFRNRPSSNRITPFWEDVRKKGKHHLYRTLIKDYGYEVVSDSSKTTHWLLRREAEALTDNIPVHKVVMFKSPEGWVGSMFKRGNEYGTLATEPEKTLQHICDTFNLPYFNGKHRYWETKNTQLYGNTNARHGKDIKYSEDKTHTEYNTKNSALIYSRLKSKAI